MEIIYLTTIDGALGLHATYWRYQVAWHLAAPWSVQLSFPSILPHENSQQQNCMRAFVVSGSLFLQNRFKKSEESQPRKRAWISLRVLGPSLLRDQRRRGVLLCSLAGDEHFERSIVKFLALLPPF